MVTAEDESRWRAKLAKRGYDAATIETIIETWRQERAELDKVFAGKPLGRVHPDDIVGPHCNED